MPKHLDKDWFNLMVKAIEDTWDTTTDWVTGTKAEQKIVKQFIEKHLKENQIRDVNSVRVDPSYKFLTALKIWDEALEQSVAAYKNRGPFIGSPYT